MHTPRVSMCTIYGFVPRIGYILHRDLHVNICIGIYIYIDTYVNISIEICYYIYLFLFFRIYT